MRPPTRTRRLARVWGALLGGGSRGTVADRLARLRAEALEARDLLAVFAAANVVVLRVGDGSGALVDTGNAVFVDEYTPAGALVQSVALPSTGTAKLVADGTSAAAGHLTRSPDGQYLALAGYDAPLGGSAALKGSAYAPSVAYLDPSAAVTVRATPAAAGLEVRGAVTSNGNDFWLVAESGGAHFYQAGGSSTTQLNSAGPAALTGLAVADGQLYVATASGTGVRIGSLGTGMPTTSGQSVAALSGVPTSAGSPHAFFFADLSAAVAGADTLYVADDSARALTKYSLAGGTWTANGTVGADADDYWGLTGRVEDGTVTLFAVRKTGSGGGELVSLADASGHGGAFSGTPTVLAAAGTNKAFRGVALAPGWYANRPPAVAVPGDQATPAGTARVFSAGNGNLITVSDPDAGAAAVRLTLSADHGTLTLAGTAGLTFAAGDGTADAAMTFTGTLVAVNAALDGLSYAPPAGYVGAAVVSVLADDLGNTGTGGARTAAAAVTVAVGAAAPAPGAPASGGPSTAGPVFVSTPGTGGGMTGSLGRAAAGLTGNDACNVSAGPVRYADGAAVIDQTDLWSDGFGTGWGADPVVDQRPRVRPGEPERHRGGEHLPAVPPVRRGGHPGGRPGRDPGRHLRPVRRGLDPAVLRPRPPRVRRGNAEYILTDTLGGVTRFHDFSTGVPAARRGRLKSYADPAGGTTSAAYTSGGLVSAVTRTGTVGGATLTESLTYTYLASPDPNAGLVATVTLERQLGSGGWQTVRSVAYAYYDGVEAHGLLGDLKTATVKDAAGDPVETKYYRYYTAGGGTGYAHGLKYLLEGDAYNRLTAAHGTNLAAVTDTQLAPFADLYFEYDSQQRVTKEMVQGAGCSVCSAGQGEYTFAYTASANAAGVNAWARKTVETLPDGNTHTAYTNAYGQVMLWAYTEAASGDKWATFYQYDGDGRVVRTAAPSAVSGWNDTYADLLHWDGDDYEYLRDAEGLVTVVGYGATTTATASAAGSVAGYQASTAVGRGEAGAPVVLSSLAYIAHTAGGATVYQVADATAYRNADGTGAETTHFAYTYFTGTTRVESVVTTLPAVTAARNGSGAADAAAAVFDARGRMIWMKDEGGFLTHAAYDEGTGAVVKWVTDVDTARTSDFTALPSGWSTPAGGGLHLVSAFEVDSLGRVTTATTPEGRVTYTRYDDDRHEVRTYAGWDATAHRPTGPTAVARDDWAGGYTEVLTMSAAPALDGGNRPTGAEAVGQLQSLSRTYRNTAGQVTHRDEYFDLTGLTHTTSTTLGTEGTHFYRTRYQYDARGWLNKTVSPQGTIYRTVSDGQGRAVSDWVGTDDTPTAGFWSPTNLAGANMVKVREYEYDGGGVGDGNLTKVTEIPGADSPDRVTRTWYDWRNRAVAVKAGVQGTEAADVNRPLTYLDLDNLGRAVRTRVYDADGVTPTATAGVPDPLSAGLLRAQSTTGFDERGRVYRTDASAVDPATGAVGASLNTSVWYDARGNVVKSAAPGGLVSKAEFDGAGRQTRAYLTDGGGDGGYADADDVAGDVVLEQSETTYDKDGNALLVVTRQRFHDATGTGALGTPTTGVGARVSYAASYYDPASRTTAVADVGTNGGSAWTRPTTAPARSDTVLVSSFEYAADAVQTVRLTGSPTGGTFTLTAGGQTTAGIAYDATPAAVDAALEALSSVGTGNVAVSAAAGGGWEVRFTGTLAGKHQAALVGGGSGLTGGSSPGVAVGTVSAGGDAGRVAAATDPRGLVARTYADTLGRTVRRVENWADGVVSDTDDKTTDFTHNGVGMTSLTARLAGGGGQTTEWVFGSLGPVASNDVVGETRWPDPSTGAASGTDRELVVADAFGGYLSVARNGTVHQLYYDPLGRVFADVAYAGPGVDDAVLRIDTAYDGQGNAYLVTSRDYSGNVVHQLRREYNGFGQLVAEWQQRGAAVNTSTSPKVGYQYSSPAGGVNHSRLIRVTYPSGYELSYDHAPGLDGRIGRLSSLSDAAGVVERYDYLGLGGVVRRQHPQPGTELTYVGTPADAGDQYAGLDRFGRVADHRWRLSGGAGSDLSRYQYGHDRNGNRLFRDDLLGLASDELYGYDGLDQVASFERGTLNTARTALTGTAARTQTWDYDALGNWESLTTDGTARARTHNRQNEVAGVAGAAATPTYDGDGNMTGDEAGRQLVYDAWNRLVAVKDAGGTTLRTYAYDGLNRRVAETVTATGVTTDLLYSAGWQVLEERVGSDTAARYVWSPVYVDALVLRDRDTDGNGSLDERLWAVQDANFNVVALLNGSGAVVERYAYDPFGAATVLDASYAVRTGGSSYGWRHLHQGLRYDAAAAQYDNYGRWYSPTLGRFTGLDPLRFAAGDVNLYRYVENGPTGRVDPSGLQPPLGPPKPLVFVPTTSPIANVTPTQYGYIKAGLENKIALDQVRANVPPDKLKLAIEFYEKTAKGPLNERAGPASAFNQARADFLRGAGPAPGGNLADFAKRAVPGGRAGGAVRAGSLVLRIAPPLALGAGLLWLADQAVEPPDSPVAPFLGGGGKSGDGGKFDGPITIPKNSTLINRLNTKCGTLQTWKLPNGEIITIEKIDR